MQFTGDMQVDYEMLYRLYTCKLWLWKMRSLSKIDKESKLVVGLIPARWHSTRFEGKPLALINGVPMIRRVYDQACASERLDTVVVLTDSQKVNDYCAKHEMRCIVSMMMCVLAQTDVRADRVDRRGYIRKHSSDEPLINPDAIDTLVEKFDKFMQCICLCKR